MGPEHQTPTNSQFPVRDASGAISMVMIDSDLTDSLVRLIYAPHRYFVVGRNTITVSLDRLIASRARPTGIANANDLMQQAYEGTVARRPPVSILKLPDERWLVTDGNSTFINALVSGWPDLPCDNVVST